MQAWFDKPSVCLICAVCKKNDMRDGDSVSSDGSDGDYLIYYSGNVSRCPWSIVEPELMDRFLVFYYDLEKRELFHFKNGMLQRIDVQERINIALCFFEERVGTPEKLMDYLKQQKYFRPHIFLPLLNQNGQKCFFENLKDAHELASIRVNPYPLQVKDFLLFDFQYTRTGLGEVYVQRLETEAEREISVRLFTTPERFRWYLEFNKLEIDEWIKIFTDADKRIEIWKK